MMKRLLLALMGISVVFSSASVFAASTSEAQVVEVRGGYNDRAPRPDMRPNFRPSHPQQMQRPPMMHRPPVQNHFKPRPHYNRPYYGSHYRPNYRPHYRPHGVPYYPVRPAPHAVPYWR